LIILNPVDPKLY